MTNSGALIFHFGAFSSIWSFFLSHFCRSEIERAQSSADPQQVKLLGLS